MDDTKKSSNWSDQLISAKNFNTLSAKNKKLKRGPKPESSSSSEQEEIEEEPEEEKEASIDSFYTVPKEELAKAVVNANSGEALVIES